MLAVFDTLGRQWAAATCLAGRKLTMDRSKSLWKTRRDNESIFEEKLSFKCLHSVYVVVQSAFHGVPTDTSQDV